MEFLDRIIPPGLEVKKTYQKVQNMMMEHEGRIRPDELYMIKSKAIKFLMEILEVLTHYKGTLCTVAAAITYLNIGILQADLENTELAIELARESFKKCIDLLEESKLTSEGILPAISANIQLGRIYVRRYLYMEAEECLKQAEDLYVKFKSDIQLDPVHMVTIMGIKEIEGDLCSKSILEKLHILTLSNFALVYYRLNERHSNTLYLHKMLSSQLSQNKLTQDLNYVAWANAAASISQYFVGQDKLSQARHHLAAASRILEKYLEILKAKGSRETSETIAAEYKDYDAKSASVAICWAEYGLALLGKSKERLLKRVEEEDQESKPAKVSDKLCKYSQTEIMEDLRFVDLEPELESITNEITDMYLLDSNDAGPVLLHVRKWLDKAKEYYIFESSSYVYTDIAENLALYYKYLLYFEDDEDRQAGIHKQRIDILEDINEIFHLDEWYYSIRKIWIDLAETYSTILDLKMNRLQANVMPMAQMVAEIKHLAKNSIKYYQLYFKSLSESKRCGFCWNDLLHLELKSYFHIGKLYNKIIISDIEQGIRNTQNSLDAYSFIVYYYDDHPEKQKELEKLRCCRIIKNMRHFVTAYVRQI